MVSKNGCQAAMPYYERYLELVPNNCQMKHEYAMCFFNNNKFKQSIPAFKSTLDCSSWSHLDSIQSLAFSYWRSGASDLSYPILVVERAILIFSKNNDWRESHQTIRLYFTLALMKHFNGNRETNTIDMWKRLLPIIPDWPAVSYYLASELEEMGDFSQARFFYQRTLDLSNNSNNSYPNLSNHILTLSKKSDFCFLNKTRYIGG